MTNAAAEAAAIAADAIAADDTAVDDTVDDATAADDDTADDDGPRCTRRRRDTERSPPIAIGASCRRAAVGRMRRAAPRGGFVAPARAGSFRRLSGVRGGPLPPLLPPTVCLRRRRMAAQPRLRRRWRSRGRLLLLPRPSIDWICRTTLGRVVVDP